MFRQEDFEKNLINAQETVPVVQNDSELPAQSQDYGDFIVKYAQNVYGTF